MLIISVEVHCFQNEYNCDLCFQLQIKQMGMLKEKIFS